VGFGFGSGRLRGGLWLAGGAEGRARRRDVSSSLQGEASSGRHTCRWSLQQVLEISEREWQSRGAIIT
jgi:hypothetical protein